MGVNLLNMVVVNGLLNTVSRVKLRFGGKGGRGGRGERSEAGRWVGVGGLGEFFSKRQHPPLLLAMGSSSSQLSILQSPISP